MQDPVVQTTQNRARAAARLQQQKIPADKRPIFLLRSDVVAALQQLKYTEEQIELALHGIAASGDCINQAALEPLRNDLPTQRDLAVRYTTLDSAALQLELQGRNPNLPLASLAQFIAQTATLLLQRWIDNFGLFPEQLFVMPAQLPP